MLRPQIERYLHVNGVPHRLLTHADEHPVESPEALEIARTKSVLIELDSGDEVICVIPEGAEVDLDALCELLQAEDAVECEVGRLIELFPGCDIGAAPPFAGLWGVPVILDSEVELSDRILMPSGSEGQILELRTDDFVYMEEPMVADIASSPGEPWKHAMPVGAYVSKAAKEAKAAEEAEAARPRATPPPPRGEEP